MKKQTGRIIIIGLFIIGLLPVILFVARGHVADNSGYQEPGDVIESVAEDGDSVPSLNDLPFWNGNKIYSTFKCLGRVLYNDISDKKIREVLGEEYFADIPEGYLQSGAYGIDFEQTFKRLPELKEWIDSIMAYGRDGLLINDKNKYIYIMQYKDRNGIDVKRVGINDMRLNDVGNYIIAYDTYETGENDTVRVAYEVAFWLGRLDLSNLTIQPDWLVINKKWTGIKDITGFPVDLWNEYLMFVDYPWTTYSLVRGKYVVVNDRR